MNMRKFQPSESLTGQASHGAGYERGIDNLIQGLVDLLPKRDGIWPLEERAKWLRLAAGIFDLGYKAGDGERREINIAVVKQEVTTPPSNCSSGRNNHGRSLRRPHRGAHEGRRPRQRHALAAQQHGGLFGPFVLGKRARVFRSARCDHPGCRERLSGRALPGPAHLGGKNVPQADPLQPTSEERPLRCVGAARGVHFRTQSGVSGATLNGAVKRRRHSPMPL